MLRSNLATRPFYNERAVHAVIGAAAILVLALSAITVTRVIKLSRQNTELSARVSRDQAEADRLTREAASIRRGLNKEELQLVADAAREANELIDRRTFSWTAFFNYIETTLPPDVMLNSVQPAVKNGVTTINMTVLARRTEDIDEFVEKLEATGAFENVLPAQEDRTLEGLERAVLQCIYTGQGAEPEETPAAPQPAPPPETPAQQKPAPQKPGSRRGNQE